jgi:hypothetical protein
MEALPHSKDTEKLHRAAGKKGGGFQLVSGQVFPNDDTSTPLGHRHAKKIARRMNFSGVPK